MSEDLVEKIVDSVLPEGELNNKVVEIIEQKAEQILEEKKEEVQKVVEENLEKLSEILEKKSDEAVESLPPEVVKIIHVVDEVVPDDCTFTCLGWAIRFRKVQKSQSTVPPTA